MRELTPMAQSLWAKKSQSGQLSWLPLAIHILDSAQVARLLWRDWVPQGVKETIASGLGSPDGFTYTFEQREQQAEQLFVFLAASHDLGKATPVFQAKSAQIYPPNLLDGFILDHQLVCGLPMPSHPKDAFINPHQAPHALATQLLLEKGGCNKKIAAILGAHHGKPPSASITQEQGIDTLSNHYHLGKIGKKIWCDIQQEILDFILDASGTSSLKSLPHPNMASQVLLCGLIIMTDWVASNESYFPYIDLHEPWKQMLEHSYINQRARKGFKILQLTVPWHAGNEWMYTNLFEQRFADESKHFEPYLMQQAVASIAGDTIKPGIMIIEAAMGQGKTEAALVAGEIFAFKSNRSGLFFALPTQATSDGIFPRIEKWIKHLNSGEKHSIRLVHAKAQFNELYQQIFDAPSNVGDSQGEDGSEMIVHEWFQGRKKALLADFVVGTIDQLLMAALKQKHVMLRHLGLAGKVIIIDECHAYDAYMNQYLFRALSWLGAYRVPVIVLSATLPAQTRRMVIEAYLNQPEIDTTTQAIAKWSNNRGYPLITWTDGGAINQKVIPPQTTPKKVLIKNVSLDSLEEDLQQLLLSGGCAGIIFNTVKRAQEMAKRLQAFFGTETVRLLHSRFLGSDRAAKEKELLAELGPKEKSKRPTLRIVVGTQVLEQSLDIDFDVLMTDLCPMDLVLQRIGRLHRHKRNRPNSLAQACCFIFDLAEDQIELGSGAIYGEYLLMRTKALMPKEILIPDDIPRLVQDVYDETFPISPQSEEYIQASLKHRLLTEDKRRRAQAYQIDPIWVDDPFQRLVGWLDTDVTDKDGEAAVRDSEESIEVLLIQKKLDGRVFFLPWVEEGREIILDQTIQPHIAKTLARQSIRLPGALCKPWIINETISQLEEINSTILRPLQQSPWLKGVLALPLDEELSTFLGGYRISYHPFTGLTYEKEEISYGK